MCACSTFVQVRSRHNIEGQLKSKKQESAKFSREVAIIEKKVREKEVEMNRRKPMYIKAKERTSHVLKRLEASKYVKNKPAQYNNNYAFFRKAHAKAVDIHKKQKDEVLD